MLGFFKRKNKNINDKAKKKVRESPEIAKARKYLESIHSTHSVLYGEQPFHYMETSEKGAFKRYHFYKGLDKRLIYVVLSDEERKEITKAFKEKMGDSYAYQDTILSSMTGGVIQHRFYRPKAFNTSITFMTDDGEIWGGNFAMDEDMFD